MANRQARRAVRKAAARFIPHNPQPARLPHSGLLPRTRDFQTFLAFIQKVYGGAEQ